MLVANAVTDRLTIHHTKCVSLKTSLSEGIKFVRIQLLWDRISLVSDWTEEPLSHGWQAAEYDSTCNISCMTGTASFCRKDVMLITRRHQ